MGEISNGVLSSDVPLAKLLNVDNKKMCIYPGMKFFWKIEASSGSDELESLLSSISRDTILLLLSIVTHRASMFFSKSDSELNHMLIFLIGKWKVTFLWGTSWSFAPCTKVKWLKEDNGKKLKWAVFSKIKWKVVKRNDLQSQQN